MHAETTIRRILLIQTNAATVESLTEMLAQTIYPISFEIEVFSNFGTLLQSVITPYFDVLLFTATASFSIQQVSQLRLNTPQLALVALLEEEDLSLGQKLIQQGVQDCLIIQTLTAEQLIHTLTYAIERQRLAVSVHQDLRQALTSTEKQLQIVTSHTAEGIIVFDQQYNILMANPAAATIFKTRPLFNSHVTDLQLTAELLNTTNGLALSHEDGSETIIEWHLLDIKWQNKTAHLMIIKDATEQLVQARKFDRQATQIEAIADIAVALRVADSFAELLSFALERIATVIHVQSGIFLLDEETNELVTASWYPYQAELIGLRKPTNTGLSGKVMASGRPYFTHDLHLDKQTDIHPKILETVRNVRSTIIIPILSSSTKTIGTLHIGMTENRSFTLDEIRLFTAVSEIISLSIERITLTEKLEQRVHQRTFELEQVNKRLLELDQLKSKFVSDMNHELRTPVTGLNLYTDLMLRNATGKERRYLEGMAVQIKRLSRLAENSLRIAEFDMGIPEMNLEEIDLNEITGRLYDAYLPLAAEQNLVFEHTLAADIPTIHASPDHVTEAIEHILDNAFLYTAAGSVQISTTYAPPYVGVTVTDSGIGIPPEDQPFIFDRFYRGQSIGQSAASGSGLGLAIVQEIIEHHYGRIKINSKSNRGTTITLLFPINQALPSE